MVSNNLTLESTKEYSLSEFFATPHRKIIIPDFQRDYTWGDKIHGDENNKDIVSEFMETLIDEFKNNNSETLLGKIDVYENPENHIYLTDGQQRITTLYLLIGILYKKTKIAELKQCLISSYEEEDDKEPYLQYAIRESSIFFLRDLVNECFLVNNDIVIKDMKKQSWFFTDYNLDPSILSMLSALETIENKLLKIEEVDKFSIFIINKVKIQYYDVISREFGEKRFIIINTTGQSLTKSENLKPILIGKITDEKYSKQWEERETWFWKNRDKKKHEQIADYGVNDFLTWCFQIMERQDSVDIIKKSKELFKKKEIELTGFLDKINAFFESIKLLVESFDNEGVQNQLKFINDNKPVEGIIGLRNLTEERQQNILLPTLVFINKISKEKEDIILFTRRLRKNYFDKKWEERKHNYVDWRHIIQIIDNSDNVEDVLKYETKNNDEDFIKISNVALNEWHNEEEENKYKLKVANRVLVEEWEDHVDFMGDLSFLFSVNQNLLNFEIPQQMALLKKYYINYTEVVNPIIKRKENNYKTSNLFRLFRLYLGCNKVGHLYNTSGDFEGVPFSTHNREHLKLKVFKELITDDNINEFMEIFIKEKIREWDLFNINENNYTTERFIKAWLTLKAFNANENEVCLAYYDGNNTGVCAYKDYNKNILIESEPFSLANSICGFGVKSGRKGSYIHYTTNNLWNNSNIINTSFAGIKRQHVKSNQEGIQEELDENKKVIDKIKKLILED